MAKLEAAEIARAKVAHQETLSQCNTYKLVENPNISQLVAPLAM